MAAVADYSVRQPRPHHKLQSLERQRSSLVPLEASHSSSLHKEDSLVILWARQLAHLVHLLKHPRQVDFLVNQPSNNLRARLEHSHKQVLLASSPRADNQVDSLELLNSNLRLMHSARAFKERAKVVAYSVA